MVHVKMISWGVMSVAVQNKNDDPRANFTGKSWCWGWRNPIGLANAECEGQTMSKKDRDHRLAGTAHWKKLAYWNRNGLDLSCRALLYQLDHPSSKNTIASNWTINEGWHRTLRIRRRFFRHWILCNSLAWIRWALHGQVQYPHLAAVMDRLENQIDELLSDDHFKYHEPLNCSTEPTLLQFPFLLPPTSFSILVAAKQRSWNGTQWWYSHSKSVHLSLPVPKVIQRSFSIFICIIIFLFI